MTWPFSRLKDFIDDSPPGIDADYLNAIQDQIIALSEADNEAVGSALLAGQVRTRFDGWIGGSPENGPTGTRLYCLPGNASVFTEGAGLYLASGQGWIFQKVGGSFLAYFITGYEIEATLDAAHATLDRYDLVQVKLTRAANGTVSLTWSIKKGLNDDTPLAPDATYVAYAYAHIRHAQTALDPLQDIEDELFPLGYSSSSSVGSEAALETPGDWLVQRFYGSVGSINANNSDLWFALSFNADRDLRTTRAVAVTINGRLVADSVVNLVRMDFADAGGGATITPLADLTASFSGIIAAGGTVRVDLVAAGLAYWGSGYRYVTAAVGTSLGLQLQRGTGTSGVPFLTYVKWETIG
jgi:hypothetical protein